LPCAAGGVLLLAEIRLNFPPDCLRTSYEHRSGVGTKEHIYLISLRLLLSAGTHCRSSSFAMCSRSRLEGRSRDIGGRTIVEGRQGSSALPSVGGSSHGTAGSHGEVVWMWRSRQRMLSADSMPCSRLPSARSSRTNQVELFSGG
jgi:hypothetical protein